MNLLSRVLPDFSTRLCGPQSVRSCSAVGAGSSSSANPRAPAQAAAWSSGIPLRCPLIARQNSQASADRRPLARSAIAVRYRPSRGCRCFAGTGWFIRRFPVSFLGDRWRGDIDLDQLRVVGDAADERSPCEVRRGPHWKKSGQCQASHNSSGGPKEEPDFS